MSSPLTVYAIAVDPVNRAFSHEKRASVLEVKGDAHVSQDSLGGGACGLLGSQQSTQPAGPVASAAKASRTGTLQVA